MQEFDPEADQGDCGITLWQFKVNFWRLLDPAARKLPRARIPPILIVCDPGPDPDDVKVVITAAKCHMTHELDVRGIVCNGGHQAAERARLARCVLRLVDRTVQVLTRADRTWAPSTAPPARHADITPHC